MRARSSAPAGALAIGVLAVYLWSLLSMLATLARTTLLSFRLQPTLSVLLVAAGAFGFVEAVQALGKRGRGVIPMAAAIGLAGAIAFSQDIPDVLRPDLTIAYTDTDGYGQRGDRRPPGSEKYYPAIDAAIRRVTGKRRDRTVVLTADYSFLSYYPYWGFQGLTPHYANPLAQFDKRATQIDSWSGLSTADEFIAALDKLPWQPPTVFLMRHGAHNNLHPAAGPGRLPQPAQCSPLHGGPTDRPLRRPAFRRRGHWPVRAGHPQAAGERVMATEAAPPVSPSGYHLPPCATREQTTGSPGTSLWWRVC